MSFAYKKGGSIKRCVELHRNSDAYVKYDISKFFNSIDFKILVETVKNVFNIYTRYADDVLISRKAMFTDEDFCEINENVESFLGEINLKINHKKEKRVFLTKDGQHIKYIGVNIVHFDAGNRLSVGRQYIYNVVNEYYQYLDDWKNLRVDEDGRKRNHRHTEGIWCE